MDKSVQLALMVIVRFYQYFLSPLLPARCRFYPTCSSYALEALYLHGGLKGGWLMCQRVCRCHPWGGSGIDFVPLPFYRYHFYFLATYPSGFMILNCYRLKR